MAVGAIPKLSVIHVGEGQLNLASNVPARDREMLAAAVGLVAARRVRPGLTPLILGAMTDVLREGGALERPGDFPAARPSDYPLLPEAEHSYRYGPPLLMRYLPFWVATVIFRLVIVVVPMLAILIPLVRRAPPFYAWRTRRRIIGTATFAKSTDMSRRVRLRRRSTRICGD